MEKLGLHLGCGSIYLKSTDSIRWINIDIKHTDSILVSEFTEEKYNHFLKNDAVTLDCYYLKPIGTLKRKIVCDEFDDIRILNKYKDNSIDDIVAFHVLEHFTMEEGTAVLIKWSKLIVRGGILRICTPNIMEICRRILNIKRHKENYLNINSSCRLLFGSHNRGAYLDGHKSCWPSDTLLTLFSSLGLKSKILPSPTDLNYNPSVYIVGEKE